MSLSHGPIKLAVEQWLTREKIEDIPTMLPKGAAMLDARTMAADRTENFRR